MTPFMTPGKVPARSGFLRFRVDKMTSLFYFPTPILHTNPYPENFRKSEQTGQKRAKRPALPGIVDPLCVIHDAHAFSGLLFDHSRINNFGSILLLYLLFFSLPIICSDSMISITFSGEGTVHLEHRV